MADDTNEEPIVEGNAPVIPEVKDAPKIEEKIEAKPEDLSIAPEAKPEPKAGEEPIVFEPTGNASLDIALEFMGTHGIGPDHEAIAAAKTGDFSKLEEALKALPDAKGWEKYLALGKEGYDNIARSVQEKASAALADIHSAVGGKENWDTIRTWAKANADADEIPVVNAALNAGGIQSKAMAFYLGTLYNSHNHDEDPADPKRHGAPAGGNQSLSPLSPKEYVDELNKLRRKVGADFETSHEAQTLAARALAFRRN